MIYLDYAATTPMSAKAIEAYDKVASTYFGNASSIHDFGSSAQQIADSGRQKLAGYIQATPRGVFFTGSGSEANSLAIRSLVRGLKVKGKHILSSPFEHSCVRNTLKSLEEEGYEITYLPVDQYGRLNPDELASHIRPDTVLATIQHTNSEIGTIQDLESIGNILKQHDIIFHSDCVQSFGKIPLDVKSFHLDSLSVSAHKIYGPKGVGMSYINPSVSWKPVLPGTTQEKGFRAGTLDTPGIAAFLASTEEVMNNRQAEAARERSLRNKLISRLQELPFDLSIEGPSEGVQPNIVGLRIHGMEGQYAMLECNRHGLAISTGSACSAGLDKPPSTMLALGRDEQESREFIRLSLGKQTSTDDIDRASDILHTVLAEHFEMVQQT